VVHLPTPTATVRPAISAAVVQTLWPVLAVVAAVALSLVEVEMIMTMSVYHPTGTLTLTAVVAGTALSVLAAVYALSQILTDIAMASGGHGPRHIDVVVILALVAFGALGATVLVMTGMVSATTIARYGLWVLLGLIAIFMFASGYTKSKVDDIFVSFLLLISIGGTAVTWAVDTGYITNAVAALGALGVMLIALFIAYARAGYQRVRRAR